MNRFTFIYSGNRGVGLGSPLFPFNPSPRDYRPSVSPLYRFTTQRRSVDSSRLSLLLDTFSACDKGYIQTPPLVFSVTGKEGHLNSSSVFCEVKYRGGGTQ